MATPIQQQVEICIEALRQGSLQEEQLRRIDALADDASKRQSILYLQVKRASLTSEVIGMSLFEAGEFHDPPGEEDWPYRSVAEALADGWRIIKFPEMALLLDEKRTYGFGWEFILEKWG
jgi:hypothetical protein